MTSVARKLVFLSAIAVPHQVKLCRALQPYFDAEFWFYEMPDRTRGRWWRIDLGEHCKILDDVMLFKSGPLAQKYLARGLARKLDAFDPDIVMLGGFSIPANYLAFRWARKNGRKTVVLTERSRDRGGTLRARSPGWRLLQHLYREVDMVMTTADDIVEQFREEFGFGDKVVAGRYAVDIDDYAGHPPRRAKSAYTYLFANRMTEIYDPIAAIEIFSAVLARHPGSRLLMNAAGELGDRCREKIATLGIANAVEFLTDIPTWKDLPKVYERADILLLPASFSNGNFTILEAMASGMGIVISNRVLGVGQLIEDGVNGFNCEPTTEAFLERIERYITDPLLFEQHAALNRTIVEPLGATGTARLYSELFRERLAL
jgi:glycosyltransferase involved in cell wall biosynthesis